MRKSQANQLLAFTNVATKIIDEENYPLQGATISVIQDINKYALADEEGNAFLNDVIVGHTIQVNYGGQQKTYPAMSLPSVIIMPSSMLDEVVITVKKENNILRNSVIGLGVLGLLTMFTSKKKGTKKVSL